MLRRRLLGDRFVPVRVERLPERLDRRNTVATERLEQLRERRGDALGQRPFVAGSLGGGDGPFQVVERGKQVTCEGRRRVLAFGVAVAGGPLLVVLEVGLRALQE